MINFFTGLNTVETIKKQYRELCKVHHPDLGGDEETMKTINAQYQQALKGCHGQKSTDENGGEHTYTYNAEREEEIAQKLRDLLALKMAGVDIYLIGVWVWIKGDTKPHKDQLKELNCRWHKKNACWYYKPEGMRTFSSGKGLDELARKYGARKIYDVKEERTLAS